MKRRQFLKGMALSGVALALPVPAFELTTGGICNVAPLFCDDEFLISREMSRELILQTFKVPPLMLGKNKRS